MTTGKMHSAKRKKFITNSAVHVILGVLAVIWVFPIIWVILTSFRAEKGSMYRPFLPSPIHWTTILSCLRTLRS